MTIDPSSPQTISVAIAAAITLITYLVFIVAPAWASYGRVWERIAASVLTVFILASVVMVGVLVGAAVVWTYDTWA
jgi:hypothetical protein